MNQYIISGIIGGVFAYIGKWIIFMIATSTPLTKWIRNFFHHNGFTMFLLDLLSGFIIIHMVNAAGSTGVTTLFVLITFSICSVAYICMHILYTKSIKLIKTYI